MILGIDIAKAKFDVTVLVSGTRPRHRSFANTASGFAQLQAWLSTSPNASTAYQLAVQLAAMDLNVLTRYVQKSDLVYAGALLPYATADGITGLTGGGFLDVQDLMNVTNAVLGIAPKALSGDPNQAPSRRHGRQRTCRQIGAHCPK